MPYAPALPADLNFSGAYTPPGPPLDLNFAPLSAILISGSAGAGLSGSGSISQTIIIAALSGNAGAGLVGDGSIDAYRGIAVAAGAVFSDGRRADIAPAIPWPSGVFADASKVAPWGDARTLTKEKAVPFGDLTPRESFGALSWDGAFPASPDSFLGSEWATLPARDRDARLPYALLEDRDRGAGFVYDTLTARDILRDIPVDTFGRHDIALSGPWLPLQVFDDQWPRLPWGEGEPPRRRPIEPPAPPIQPPPPPVYANTLPADLCFYELADETLPADLTFRRLPSCRDRGTLAMIHELTLARLPELTPVKITAASLTIGHGDMAWGARLVVPTRADLDLIAPNATGLREVALTIDGHVWWLLVEGYEEDRRFGESAFSVSCRSPTAWLSSPYAQPVSQNTAQAWNGQQLCDNSIAGLTGWSVDWRPQYQGDLSPFNWSVPAGAWRHEPLTPISAIMAVAEAIGGVVEPARAAYQVAVRYRHHVPRWQWDGATPDVVLPTSRIYRVAGSYEPKTEFDKVYVFGEEGGAAAGVKRTGHAGNTQAPSVVDPLLTTTPACTERGRQILSAAGNRLNVTVEAPFGDGVAPLWCGQLVEVFEAVPWRGMSVALNISAQRSGIDGAITASQTATIERAV